jgi:hypothetical protein
MREPLTIRRSTPDDRAAILGLAALDSRRAPEGDALLGFAGHQLRAALPLDGGAPVADPFHATAEIVDLLRLRATQMTQRGRSRPALARRSLRLRAA